MSNAATGSDVFLSYSRADAAAVQAVRARLTEAGVDSFLDRTGLRAGQPWQPFLERELRHSGAVAVVHQLASLQPDEHSILVR